MLTPEEFPPDVVDSKEERARVAQPPRLGEQRRGPLRVHEVAAANRGALLLRAYNTVKRAMRWHDFGSGREARPAA